MPKRQQFPYPGSWVPGTESDTYRLEPMIASVVDLTSQTPAIAGPGLAGPAVWATAAVGRAVVARSEVSAKAPIARIFMTYLGVAFGLGCCPSDEP